MVLIRKENKSTLFNATRYPHSVCYSLQYFLGINLIITMPLIAAKCLSNEAINSVLILPR